MNVIKIFFQENSQHGISICDSLIATSYLNMSQDFTTHTALYTHHQYIWFLLMERYSLFEIAIPNRMRISILNF